MLRSLRSIEQTALSAQMRCYLLARDSSGIAAAFECGIEMSANSHASLDEVLFGRAAGIAKAACLHPFPALVVRNRLCRPGLPDEVRRSLDQILLEAVERMAREKRATICFRQVTHGDSTLVELLRAPSVPT